MLKFADCMKWVSKPTFLLYTGLTNMGNFEEKLYIFIRPLCDHENIYLEDISVHGNGKNRVVKLIVDTDTGITLNQCQDLSKKISELFYRKDIIDGDYRLEVSSPGTNKPLEKSYEFRRSIGKDLHINYRINDEIKSITGKLIAFNGDEITVQQKNNEISISLSDIEKANIKLKW
jgi:ribosome maturation factor RimP